MEGSQYKNGMNSLKEYLVSARKYNTPKIKAFVSGNSSVDMDSVVGSITMSWLCGVFRPGEEQYSPFINCPRNELAFRIEIVEHLNLFGINEQFLKENVFFADDEEVKDLTEVKSVGLVDFNELTPEFKSVSDRVHYIIDHHVDNKLYLDSVKEEPTIRVLGSA